MRVVLVTSVVFALTVALCGSGCGDDRRLSRKGEACQVSNDCEEGLACVPMNGPPSGFCVLAHFDVAPLARQCAIVECVEPSDCCNGIDCDLGRLCEQNRCLVRCQGDDDCVAIAGGRCSAGKCVACVSDGDCGDIDARCVSGSCIAACKSDGDCPGFNRCSAGRCVPSGCQTDRECIASTRNVEAKCGADARCTVPCATDLECGSPTSYGFFSCIDRRCTYVGCQSDKECRLAYGSNYDGGAPRVTFVCRDAVGSAAP